MVKISRKYLYLILDILEISFKTIFNKDFIIYINNLESSNVIMKRKYILNAY